MNRKTRIIVRYALFQIPDLIIFAVVLILIGQVFEISKTAFWIAFGVWLAKDVALYPLVGRFYDPYPANDRFKMVGKTGLVKESLTPRGKVQIRGELWQAVPAQKGTEIQSGQKVVVRDIEGLTLLVAPLESGTDRKQASLFAK